MRNRRFFRPKEYKNYINNTQHFFLREIQVQKLNNKIRFLPFINFIFGVNTCLLEFNTNTQGVKNFFKLHI